MWRIITLWAKIEEPYQDESPAGDSPLGRQQSLGLNFSLCAAAVKSLAARSYHHEDINKSFSSFWFSV